MTPGRARLSVAWLLLHFSLVLLFALRDLFSVLPAKASSLPETFDSIWRPAEAAVSASLGQSLPIGSVTRRLIATYGDITGIEAGYSYFAPSVPSNCKLLFELHYAGNRVEYDLPHVRGAAAGYRVATLLDYLTYFRRLPLREAILKPLVYECWKRHPDAVRIRAIVAIANLPSVAEYRRGIVTSYEQAYAYDFQFPLQPADSKAR